MYKITNIETLGTDYAVANQDGKIIKHVRIIPQSEILDAALGKFNYDEELQSYIDKSIAVLEGNEDINPYKIYWHATIEEEVSLHDIIEYAVKHGYDTIIMEHLEITEY